MVSVICRKKGIRLKHVWFADIHGIMSCKDGADVLFVHGSKCPGLRHSVCLGEQHSLIKEFSGSEEDVWNSFGKHLKAYIKRSQREGSYIRFFRGENINAPLLDLCAHFYEQMKAAKGIPDSFNRNLAKQYAKNDTLMISMAYVKGNPVGFNAYIVDAMHFRTWLTAFAFREEEFDPQAVSRAHQLLEWETMRWCCQNGITSYDFGGITSFENPNGIDKFKMTFAKDGRRITYDNYLVGVSPVGKAVVLAYKLLKKMRK